MDAKSFTGTGAVDPRQAFDVARLEQFLKERIAGFAGPLAVEQFKGGQSNPTFKLVTPRRNYVLRRKPAGKLLASAHAVDREYQVITALASTAVPVARTHVLCEDDSIIGTAFYVMDCVDGRVLWDPALPGSTPAERRAIFQEMNRVISALHKVDYTRIGLAAYGRPGNYFERQIARLTKQYRASETGTIDAMDKLMRWLPEHIPAGDETTIVHGDYRLDNLIFHPTEPRIVAVLDWELSTLGDPLADFSYHCLTWHIPADVFRGLGGANLTELGIPSEAEHVAMYCKATGRGSLDPDHWDFCMAYNLFRLAALLQGIAGRVKDGTAASPQARMMGATARPLAEMGWRRVLGRSKS
jgi:aminoglycoside phosphotransferase (APT) family kinase protein